MNNLPKIDKTIDYFQDESTKNGTIITKIIVNDKISSMKKYDGQLKKNIPHGKGIMNWYNIKNDISNNNDIHNDIHSSNLYTHWKIYMTYDGQFSNGKLSKDGVYYSIVDNKHHKVNFNNEDGVKNKTIRTK